MDLNWKLAPIGIENVLSVTRRAFDCIALRLTFSIDLNIKRRRNSLLAINTIHWIGQFVVCGLSSVSSLDWI